MKHTTLCVLAGGRSRRFGSPKEKIELDGMPIITSIMRRLRSLADSTCISVARPWPRPPGWGGLGRLIVDQCDDAGPLAAMATASDAIARWQTAQRSQIFNSRSGTDSKRSSHYSVIFVTVDMPQVSLEHIRTMQSMLVKHEKLAGVMARHIREVPRKRIEPFPSIWRLDHARDLLRRAIAAGERSPSRLALRNCVQLAPISARLEYSYLNVNRPKDLARLQQ